VAGDNESRHVAASIGLLAARNYLALGNHGGGGDRSPPNSPGVDVDVDPTTTTMTTPNYSVPPELLSIYVPGYRSREAGDTSGSESGSYCSINEFYSRGGELYDGSDDGSGIRYPNGPSPRWWMNHHLICKRRMRPLHARLPSEKRGQCRPCPPGTAGSDSGSSVSAGSSGSTPQEWNYGISSDDSVNSASPPDSLDGRCCHEWPHDEHGDHIAGSDHDEWNSDASNCSVDSVQILDSSSDDDDIQEISRSGPCIGKGYGAMPKRRKQRSPRITKKRRANRVQVCCRDPKAESTPVGMVSEICCSMPISGPRTTTKASNIMRSSMLKTLTDGIASPVPYNRGIYDHPGHTVAFKEEKSGVPSSIILGIPAVDGTGFTSEACFRRKLTDAEIAADGVSSPVPGMRHVHDYCNLLADGDSSIDLFCQFPPDLPFTSRRYNFVSVLCIDPVGGFELESVQVANDSSTGFYCAPLRRTETDMRRTRRFAWPWFFTGLSWLVTTIAVASADQGASPKVILQQDEGFKCPENFILIKLNLIKN